MSLGINLKKLRQENNLTQEELAKRINTSRSNIANYENDKNMPSIDILERLAKVFKCSTDFLIGLDDFRNLYEEYSDIQKSILILDKLSRFEIEFLEKIINNSFGPLGNFLTTKDHIKEAVHSNNISEQELDFLVNTVYIHFKLYFYDYPIVNGKHTFTALSLKEFNRLNEIELQKTSNFLSNQENVNLKQYYMCPVYRSHISRHTKLGRRMYRRKNTNRPRTYEYS